jgi:alpha-methylacyl-CoA racemase
VRDDSALLSAMHSYRRAHREAGLSDIHAGPLVGLKVIELGGIGPVPHAAMMLGDLGADVVRVDPPPHAAQPPTAPGDQLLRNRRRVLLDLKDPGQPDALLRLAGWADVLMEGFRPGVVERLGVGPEACQAANPRLIYGRMTGWGEDGPQAARAGHDINYISVTGVLHAIGNREESPVPPLNLVGDHGGGSMLLLVGILAALAERASSGAGQVIDAAMVDGATVLAQLFWFLRGNGGWTDERGANPLDGGAPFYGTYRCADWRSVAVVAIEPPFYRQLLEGSGWRMRNCPASSTRQAGPACGNGSASCSPRRPATSGRKRFSGTDACVTPVLTFAEAPSHPQLRARAAHLTVDGITQAAPAPRFSGRRRAGRPRRPRRPARSARCCAPGHPPRRQVRNDPPARSTRRKDSKPDEHRSNRLRRHPHPPRPREAHRLAAWQQAG